MLAYIIANSTPVEITVTSKEARMCVGVVNYHRYRCIHPDVPHTANACRNMDTKRTKICALCWKLYETFRLVAHNDDEPRSDPIRSNCRIVKHAYTRSHPAGAKKETERGCTNSGEPIAGKEERRRARDAVGQCVFLQ